MSTALDPTAAAALVRKIKIVLANHAHLDLVANEAFQIMLGEKLQQANDDSVTTVQITAERSVMGTSMGPTSTMQSGGNTIGAGDTERAEPAVDFDTAVGLVYSILERTQLRYDRPMVRSWVASACSTFALSRSDANAMTDSRVRFAVDWVLRCLADHAIRGLPDYFNRQFLLGFGHDTSIGDSGLLLSGAVAHGFYGNIWLHAKEKRTAATRSNPCDAPTKGTESRSDSSKSPSSPRESRRKSFGSRRTSAVLPSPGGMSRQSLRSGEFTDLRTRHVVCSVSKSWCRLPPELLSKRIKFLIEMKPPPYVLALKDAYEDLEHIHLVYEGLYSGAVCLTDKVFDDMHLTEDEADDHGFCERTVQQIIWKLLSSLKEAHKEGLVHGSLRMGCCYLNDPDDLDSLQILEFGLSELFECPEATPPAMVLTPLGVDRADPVPAYRRDFQCVAEMTYLMLGGQPISSLNSSLEELAQRFRRGTVSFSDKVYAKTSENAKAFVLDILRPVHYKKNSKIHPCHEVAIHMSHRWFRPRGDHMDQLNELYDIIVMRKYDTWRNTLRLRTNFMKILADHMSLKRIAGLWDSLARLSDGSGFISWVVMVPQILKTCPILHLLQKVNKAFGENEEMPVIHIGDTRQLIEAWRRKRVREILWQVFNRSKAHKGVMASDSCLEGLTSGVLHVWSRPLRVIDIIFPPEADGSEGPPQRMQDLVGNGKTVSFLDLVSKTDAASLS